MDAAKIRSSLRAFIKRHRKSFSDIATRETALLEMGALVMASEHYRLSGYEVTAQNTKGKVFNVKLSARGNPYNFSWFECRRQKATIELHANLAVAGAHNDGAIYVVDVAVVRANCVPREKPKKPWKRLDNDDLLTFVEVKKLVVYPMLLAQFVGIVHEIMPYVLGKASLRLSRGSHFPPALITLGYLKGTSEDIIKGFKKRRYNVRIVPNFEVHLATIRLGEAERSPFVRPKTRV